MQVLAELLSLGLYLASFYVLPSYFDQSFVATPAFWWKTLFIALASCVPVSLGKAIKRRCSPQTYQKLVT